MRFGLISQFRTQMRETGDIYQTPLKSNSSHVPGEEHGEGDEIVHENHWSSSLKVHLFSSFSELIPPQPL